MSISVRKSIRWLPGEPSEDTSTLVLTSPKHSYYVDIRVLDVSILPGPVARTLGEQIQLPRIGSAVQGTKRLDWAFAGTSTRSIAWRSTPHGFGGELDPVEIPVNSQSHGMTYTRAKWTHLIDSRDLHPENVVDEASMEDISPNMTLERGKMIKPQTGIFQDYEEIWEDFPVETLLDDGAIGTRSGEEPAVDGATISPRGSKLKPLATHVSAGEAQEANATRAMSTGAKVEEKTPFRSSKILRQGKVSVVLYTRNEKLQMHGMIVRVGQWCQGMLRKGEDISCERWYARYAEDECRTLWECVLRIGQSALPCQYLWMRQFARDDEIVWNGLIWKCVERVIWF